MHDDLTPCPFVNVAVTFHPYVTSAVQSSAIAVRCFLSSSVYDANRLVFFVFTPKFTTTLYITVDRVVQKSKQDG